MEKSFCIVSLLLTVVAVSLGQDGCPPLLPGTVGTCAEVCTNDGDCLRGQKCCSNGCGHECKAIHQTCSPVTCDKPGCHLIKDDNNCHVCKCDKTQATCQDKVCPEGFKCVLQQVQCIRAPCPPIPQCVETKQMCDNSEPPLLTSTGDIYFCGRGGKRCPDGYVCHTDPADSYAVCCPNKTECPQVSCRPECRLKKDDKGCDTCDCDDICPVPDCLPSCSKIRRGKDGCQECYCDTVCPTIACPRWCRSKRDERGCVVCDCQDPCPVVACLPGCRVIKDDRGCETCDCKDPCQNLRCEPGKICQVQPMPCLRSPCPEQAVCVDDPRCPPISCSRECPPNKGPDGCDFCDCGDPCQECRPDQTCEVINLPCTWRRCLPPIGICKDRPAPPSDKRCTTKPRLTSCSRWFRYRYIYDVNYGTCRRLRRRTCSSSLNKFRTMRDCEAACKAPVPPITIDPPEPIDGFPVDVRQVGRWQPIRSSLRIRN